MDTQAIKAFAKDQYLRNIKTIEDEWFTFDDNWAINIYLPEWDTHIVKCQVCAVIDGDIDTSISVYSFSFLREA